MVKLSTMATSPIVPKEKIMIMKTMKEIQMSEANNIMSVDNVVSVKNTMVEKSTKMHWLN